MVSLNCLFPATLAAGHGHTNLFGVAIPRTVIVTEKIHKDGWMDVSMDDSV